MDVPNIDLVSLNISTPVPTAAAAAAAMSAVVTEPAVKFSVSAINIDKSTTGPVMDAAVETKVDDNVKNSDQSS